MLNADPQRRRTFLFLQGPSSLLFRRIAKRLEQRGHRCLRINLCTGDWIFWQRRGAMNFRGRIDAFAEYVGSVMNEEQVTDLILLGEERPHHKLATAAAKALGIATFAIEMGYLRPDWIRIESDGGGFHSHFPIDASQIIAAGSRLPSLDRRRRYSQTFVADASLDLLFNLSNVFFWFLYPHYRWHAIYHPLAEYWGWIGRLASGRRRRRETDEVIERLRADAAPFYIFPLQLETDYQIRAYSPFASQRDAIDMVLASFANCADRKTRMLFKLHPLDNAIVDWQSVIETIAKSYDIADRVFFVDGGRLDQLLADSQGVITINSTVGVEAIEVLKPVKVLGVAVYDIDGLTASGLLDRFWVAPPIPDAALADAFLRLLGTAIHVRGNFYSFEGSAAGAEAIARRLDENTVNQPGGYVDPPPRLRPARPV